MAVEKQFSDSRTGPYVPREPGEPASEIASPVPGYEILEQLGRGGMGVVYRAREIALNRSVALKLVLGSGKTERKALIRFLAEAEAVAAIDHPNVVRVYRYGEAGGQPYMALEYLRSGSLAGKLKRDGKLPYLEAVDLVLKIARGVAAAHALGIVHRDLKPANILLDAPLEPKVADFGLARRGASDLTQTGAVMGTPSYMAPEQAKGESKFVGPAADVWAIGVILFESLSGERPFSGEDTWDVLHKVMNEAPAFPRSATPRIPRDLELICLRCLEKAPHERYPSAAELAEDLERFADGRPVSVRKAGAVERAVKWAKRKPTLAGLYASALAAAIFLAVGGAIAWLYRGESVARGLAVEEKGKAELAQGEAERAKAGEAKARGETEDALKREAVAHGETKSAREALADQDALRKVDLAHRAIQEENSLRGLRILSTVDPARRAWEWRYAARLAQPEEKRFRADGGNIVSLAVEKEGRIAFAACEEGVRVWEMDTGKERTGYRGHPAAVRHIALHPDGKRAVSGAADGSVHSWDIASGKRLRDFKVEQSDEIIRTAIRPDGKTLAVGRPSGVISLWNFETGEPTGELKGHLGLVLALQFHPDGRLLSSGQDGAFRVWNVETKGEVTPKRKSQGFADAIWSIEVSPDGKQIYTGHNSGAIRHYSLSELDSGGDGQFFKAHESRVLKARPSADGKQLLTASMDRTAKVWDLIGVLPEMPGGARPGGFGRPQQIGDIKPQATKVFRGHFSDVMDGEFLGDGKRVLTCADATLRVFDASRDSTSLVAEYTNGPTPWKLPVVSLQFSPDSRTLAGVVANRTCLWDAETGRQLTALDLKEPPRFFANSLAIGPDGKTVAEAAYYYRINGPKKFLNLWSPSGETDRGSANEDPIAQCVFLPSMNRLALLGPEGMLKLWDTEADKPIWKIQTNKSPNQTATLARSPDGKILATAGRDRAIKLWNAADGKPLRELTGHTHHVNCVAFSPDGKRLASASSDNTSRIWDVETGAQLRILRTRVHYIYAVAFSPDGSRLAEASGDGVITIYDARTGQDAIVLTGHKGEVKSLAFSPDGSRLASAGADGTLRIWEAPLKVEVDLPAWSVESFDPTGKR